MVICFRLSWAMADVINLNRARKVKARVEDKARAVANRARLTSPRML